MNDEVDNHNNNNDDNDNNTLTSIDLLFMNR